MKILNLYAGMGGNRKLWGDEHEITAIELNKEIAKIYKKNFPKDKVFICDAHVYLLKHYKEYDFIWSSPPCPTHSEIYKCTVYSGQNKASYPDMTLYQEIIFLKHLTKKDTKWVVENVKPYYEPLIKPSVCLGRHYFWTNFYVRALDISDEEMRMESIKINESKYGFNISDEKIKHRKDQLLRNLVNPKIGLYLLEQSKKGVQPLFNFNY